MAIAVVQHKSAGGSSSATTAAADFSAATALVAIMGAGSFGGLPALTSSPSNTWNTRSSTSGSSSSWLAAKDVLSSPAVNTTMTATATSSFAGPCLALLGITGCGGYDGTPVTGTSPSSTSGSLSAFTPAQSGDLLIACIAFDSGGTGISTPTGFTLLESPSTGGQLLYVFAQVYNSTSPITVSWTWTGTDDAQMLLLAYSPSGGGAAAATVRVIKGTGVVIPQSARRASQVLRSQIGNVPPSTHSPRLITSAPPAVRPVVRGRSGILAQPVRPTVAVPSVSHRVLANVKATALLVRTISRVFTHPVGNATPLVRSQRVIASKPPAVTPVVRGKLNVVARPASSAPPVTGAPPHRIIAATKAFIAPWFTRGKIASPRLGALIATPKYQTIRSGPPAVRPIDRRSSVTRPAAGAAAIVPVVHRVVRSGPPPVKALDRKSIVTRPASSTTPPVIPPRHRSIASSLRVLVRTIARVWRGEIGGPAPITSTVRAQLPTSLLFSDLSTTIAFHDLSTTLYYLNDDGALSMFPLQFKQGTTGPVTFPLLGADGTPKDLTGASAVTMTVTKPNGVAIITARPLAIAGAPTLGQVTWTRLAADTAIDGGYGIEVRVVNADGTIEKFPDPDSAELVITPSPTL